MANAASSSDGISVVSLACASVASKVMARSKGDPSATRRDCRGGRKKAERNVGGEHSSQVIEYTDRDQLVVNNCRVALSDALPKEPTEQLRATRTSELQVLLAGGESTIRHATKRISG